MSVKIFFEIGHVASVKSRPTAEGYTHDWELFVRGLDDNDISHFIDKVVFNLHESFPKPKRVFKEPPYLVKEAGYAGFILPVEIYFKNRDDPKKAVYNYDLDLTPVKNQREEYVFHNPSDEFRRKLLKGGGFMQPGGSGLGNNASANDYKGNRGAHAGGGAVERSSSSSSSQDKKAKSKSSATDDTKGSFAELFGSPFSHKPSGSGSSSKVSPDPKQQSAGSGSRKTSPPGGPGGGVAGSKGPSGQKASGDSRSLPNSSTTKESSKDKSSSSSSSSSKHKHSSPNKESKKSSNSISSSAGSGMAEEKHSKDKKDKSHSKERDKSGKEKATNSGNSNSGSGVAVGSSTQSLSHSGAGGSSSTSASMKRPATGGTIATNNSNTSGSISNSINSNNPTVPTSGNSSLSTGSSSGMHPGGAKTSDGAGQKRSSNEKEKKSSKKEKKSYEKEKERPVESTSSGQRKAERSVEAKGNHPSSNNSSGQQVAFSKADLPSGAGTKPSFASSSVSKSHPANEGGQQLKDGGVKTSANSNVNASGSTGGYTKDKKIHGSVESVSAKSDQTVNSSTAAAGSVAPSKGGDKNEKLVEKDEARKHKHKKKDKSKDKEKDRASVGKEKKERKEKDKGSVTTGNGSKGASFSTPTRESNDSIPSKASKQPLSGSEQSAKPTGHDREKGHHGFSSAGGGRHQQPVPAKSSTPIAALIGEISGEDNSNDSDDHTGDGDSRAPSTIANEKDSEASNSSIADMLGTNSVPTAHQRPASATSSSTTTSSVRDPTEKFHHHKSKKDKASSRAASSSSTSAQPLSPIVADAKDNSSGSTPVPSTSNTEPIKKRKRKNKDSEVPAEKVTRDAAATVSESTARERRSVSPPSPTAASSGASLMEPPAKVPKKDDAYGGSGKTGTTDTADHTNNNINNNSIKQSVGSGGGDDTSGNSSYYGASSAASASASTAVSGAGASNSSSLTGDYMSELKDLQHKIMTLQDNNELQRVVEMIAATGCYEITSATFDFDLCALDRLTVQRLQEFFATS